MKKGMENFANVAKVAAGLVAATSMTKESLANVGGDVVIHSPTLIEVPAEIFSPEQKEILEEMSEDELLTEIVKMGELHSSFTKTLMHLITEINVIEAQINNVYQDGRILPGEKYKTIKKLSKRLPPLEQKRNQIFNTITNLEKHRDVYISERNSKLKRYPSPSK